ncbi:MAG: signal peptidase [Abditibacteriota bacterium]|nr:signal peptidase [Abditibacteriota bacterium]
MSINFDSWPIKIAIVLALIAARTICYYGFVARATRSGDTERVQNARGWLETIDSAALVMGVMLLWIQPFILQAFYIPSGSMEDTLRYEPVGDRLLVSKMVYHMREPHRDEIVVFRAPAAATRGTETPADADFIKRCVGIGGDVVYAVDGKYFRNGRLLKEPHVKWDSPRGYYDMKIVGGKIYARDQVYNFWREAGYGTVYTQEPAPDQERIEAATPEAIPSGHFMMLGDHRDQSSDSHAWGFVPSDRIVGKAFFIFWPFARIRLVDHLSPASAVSRRH